MRSKLKYRDIIRYYDTSFLNFLFLYIRSFFVNYEIIINHIPKGSKIIDIGCGHGFLSNYINLHDADSIVLGIDIDEERINFAKSSIKERKNILFEKNEIEFVDVSNYNTVLIIDVLHYLPFEVQTEIIKKISKKLTSNNILIIRDVDTKPKLKFLWNYTHEFLMTKISITKSKNNSLYFRSSMETSNILQKFGFEVEIIRNTSFLPYTDTLFLCKKL